MNNQYEKIVSIQLIDVLKNTVKLRGSLVQELNNHDASILDGVISLISIACGNCKQVDIDKDNFLEICETLYSSIVGTTNDDDIFEIETEQSEMN